MCSPQVLKNFETLTLNGVYVKSRPLINIIMHPPQVLKIFENLTLNGAIWQAIFGRLVTFFHSIVGSTFFTSTGQDFFFSWPMWVKLFLFFFSICGSMFFFFTCEVGKVFIFLEKLPGLPLDI